MLLSGLYLVQSFLSFYIQLEINLSYLQDVLLALLSFLNTTLLVRPAGIELGINGLITVNFLSFKSVGQRLIFVLSFFLGITKMIILICLLLFATFKTHTKEILMI